MAEQEQGEHGVRGEPEPRIEAVGEHRPARAGERVWITALDASGRPARGARWHDIGTVDPGALRFRHDTERFDEGGWAGAWTAVAPEPASLTIWSPLGWAAFERIAELVYPGLDRACSGCGKLVGWSEVRVGRREDGRAVESVAQWHEACRRRAQWGRVRGAVGLAAGNFRRVGAALVPACREEAARARRAGRRAFWRRVDQFGDAVVAPTLHVVGRVARIVELGWFRGRAARPVGVRPPTRR